MEGKISIKSHLKAVEHIKIVNDQLRKRIQKLEETLARLREEKYQKEEKENE